MPLNFRRIGSLFHGRVTAWAILLASIALTVVAYFLSASFVKQRAEDRFQFRAAEIDQAIRERLHVYEQVLWGVVGFMYSIDDVTRKKFVRYVDLLNINRHWPGIQGIGFSLVVAPEDKRAHIDRIRGEGFPEYAIKPPGEREIYTAIIYLEPLDWRNRRAIGYDMWSEGMRRTAMTRARDEGVSATSGIVTLVQETEVGVQKGFLMYLPVYQTKNVPPTAEERRRDLVGWVYSPFRAGDLMKGIIGTEDPNIEFEIFDGETMSKDSLLFDSNESLHLEGNQHHPDSEKTVQLTLQGRPWTIYFNTPRGHSMAKEARLPQFVAFAGIVVDLLLFYVIYSLSFINKRAEALAKEMTVELQRAKSGLETQVNERTAELQAARGDLEEKLSALMDSEQRKMGLEHQLRESQKMEAIGRLTGGVAHDFNNLLGVITGYCELSLPQLPEGPLRQNLQEIKEAGERATDLTRQLLAFSRRQVLQPQVFNLNQSLGRMDRMLQRLIGEDIHILTYFDPDLGQVKTDPTQMEQVILNLALNARDAMPQGGSLTLETKNVVLDREYAAHHPEVRPGPYAMLAVSDTGKGMGAEEMSHVFEPFFTTKERGKGTGLGLATAYGVVKQSGGHVSVYSEPGRGSTFKIYLPRVDDPTPPLPPPDVSLVSLSGSETVLLVEDEARLLRLFSRILKEKGYTVLEASSGQEALRVGESHEGPIALLVTDVIMPGLSGRETADRLASKRPGIRVLYLSGYTDNAIVHHGVLDEGTNFLQKPFTPEALAQKVRNVLDKA